MFNLIFYYCQNYFNLSVSYGLGKSQLRRQTNMCELAFIEYNPTFDSIMLFDVTIKTSK
jgi:hypothetical protein